MKAKRGDVLTKQGIFLQSGICFFKDGEILLVESGENFSLQSGENFCSKLGDSFGKAWIILCT